MASEADVEEEDVSATAENVPDEILMWEKDALERLWEEIPLHGYLGALQRCMVLAKPGDYQAQPCRSVLPLPDDVCVPREVAEGLTPWHPSLFAFNRGEDLLAERALELAQRLVPRGIRGVRVGDPASYIANWLANNMPISWIDQVKMFTAQTSEWQELSKYRPTIATEASERLEIAAEALGRMGAVRCARCGHRVIFMMAERPSTGWNGPLGSGLHSWLPGYGWLTTACMGCHLMLGWVFVPMHGQYPHKIWAIMRDHVGLTSGR
ncbi:hypothetical protein F751_3775 [Auxenochlorella protothecoides]|uniref:Uncharacterized protein n=2 Tax=Auxenochlorella protothecoides TaxID=3075 RepID=A0A087SGA9_AUXPR|nr:hypothetical protein F751_3775 [Auxenochlorella protothecoides]KFM24763.1 hypothetical protein F751_3775 [Auxenochlorella protothecoides]